MPRALPTALAASALLLATIATAANFEETSDLRNRVDKLTGKMTKLSKSQLKKFYAVRYSDSQVSDARHHCYLALVDHVNLRKEQRKRAKDIKRTRRDLLKLRKGYGKLAGLTAAEVLACEERRTEVCDKLLKLSDDHQTRYFRSEIDIVGDELRNLEEAVAAHTKMADRALQQCRSLLNSLG